MVAALEASRVVEVPRQPVEWPGVQEQWAQAWLQGQLEPMAQQARTEPPKAVPFLLVESAAVQEEPEARVACPRS